MNEAAYLYINAEKFDKTLECFVLALNFEGCRYLHSLKKIDKKMLNDSLTTIESRLVSQNKFNEIIQLRQCMELKEVFILKFNL